jgi:hypothetical protein
MPQGILENCENENSRKELLGIISKSLYSDAFDNDWKIVKLMLTETQTSQEVSLKDSFKKALLQTTNQNNNIFLHLAAQQGNIEMFTMLKKNGADICNQNPGKSFDNMTSVVLFLDYLKNNKNEIPQKLPQLLQIIELKDLDASSGKIEKELTDFVDKLPRTFRKMIKERLLEIKTPKTAVNTNSAQVGVAFFGKDDETPPPSPGR